jgi:hypothetical protein
MLDMSQIALDANIANYDAQRADVELLTRRNEYQSISGEGFGMKFGSEFVGSEHVAIANDSRELHAYAKQMALDAETFNISSNGVLPWYTTVFTNKMIEQLFQTTPYTVVSTPFQQGQFGSTNVMIPVIAPAGVSKPYDDFSTQGDSSINVTWVNRPLVTLEQTLSYGDLATAQMSLAKIDFVAKMREGVAKIIALDMNKIFFNGYAIAGIEGLINNSGLRATIAFPNGASGSPLWLNKTYLEISDDIRSLYADCASNGGGQIDFTAKAFLLIPPTVYAYLTKQNTLGTQSVMEYLSRTFTGLEIVQVQNYQGTGSPIGSVLPNYCQLVFKEVGGQDCVLNTFATPYNSHGVLRQLSSYAEKISYVPGGAIVAMPIGVATGSGL